MHSIRKNEPPYDKLKATKSSIWVPRKRVNIKSKVIGRAMISYTAKAHCKRNVKPPHMDIWSRRNIWSSVRKIGNAQKWYLAVENNRNRVWIKAWWDNGQNDHKQWLMYGLCTLQCAQQLYIALHWLIRVYIATYITDAHIDTYELHGLVEVTKNKVYWVL